jgi:hypothetical protein
MAKKEDVMGTGIGARQPVMQSRKQVMPGRMQKPMQPQYGAQQNMRQNMPQYGGMQNMQPGGQPMRPAPAVMPPNWQQPQQPRPAPAVMPRDWQQPQQPRFARAVMPGDWQQQPALMQMMMQRK